MNIENNNDNNNISNENGNNNDDDNQNNINNNYEIFAHGTSSNREVSMRDHPKFREMIGNNSTIFI